MDPSTPIRDRTAAPCPGLAAARSRHAGVRTGAALAACALSLALPLSAADGDPPVDAPRTDAPVAAGNVTPGQISVLRLEQLTSGLADRGRDASSPARGGATDPGASFQVLWVDPSGQRVRLEEFARPGDERPTNVYTLVPDGSAGAGDGGAAGAGNGAGAIAREFPAGGIHYREHRGDFNDHQKRRRIHESEMIAIIAGYPGAKRREALAKLHLLPDGRREVEARWLDAAPRLGYPCRRLVVTENGRTVLDADIATLADTPGALHPAAADSGAARPGGSYFEMYRRLGVFSTEVLEKIRDVEGTPLRASITVVTELAPYTIEARVESIAARQVPASFFDLPDGAEKIPDVPPISTCPVCGKRFETRTGARLFTEDGVVHACSAKCFETLRETIGQPPRRTPRGERP